MNEYWFRSMTLFNIYIKQLPRWRDVFLVDFQDLEFISEVAKIILELGSNFTNKVKQKSNWE